ncbi:MAG TPA: hypothetical protein VK249_30940 [Anaerolineales bacterium]|nr:hypothetical protein [Anaerolineales bacterium]
MNTVPATRPNHVRVIWLAVALALVAALAYVLIALDFLGIGDLKMGPDGDVIIYVAAGSYLLGGLLILVRRRWLWIIGALINALVMLFFFKLYQERPAVMFSPGGIITKIPQLLLEVALIYLIATDWLGSRKSGG